MLAITFKNVGHGDTIIVGWQNDLGENEMGIIDCHQAEGKPNPAIEHIKKKNYKKIRFMILSHPHTDHFSGFPSLLEFCKKNHITIERFWHTASYDAAFLGEFFNKTTPDDFFDSFVSQKRDRIKLRGLFREIDNLHGGTVLKKAGIANDTSWLNLNKKLRIEFLSPSGYKNILKINTTKQGKWKINTLILYFTYMIATSWISTLSQKILVGDSCAVKSRLKYKKMVFLRLKPNRRMHDCTRTFERLKL